MVQILVLHTPHLHLPDAETDVGHIGSRRYPQMHRQISPVFVSMILSTLPSCYTVSANCAQQT